MNLRDTLIDATRQRVLDARRMPAGRFKPIEINAEAFDSITSASSTYGLSYVLALAAAVARVEAAEAA